MFSSICQIKKALETDCRCAILDVRKGKAIEAATPYSEKLTLNVSRQLLRIVGDYFFFPL